MVEGTNVVNDDQKDTMAKAFCMLTIFILTRTDAAGL